MISRKKLKDLFSKALNEGWTPSKLAASVSIGLYIAFSPFFGAHTIMMFVVQWLFRLNLPILFISISVNNPWTMIPVYSSGYAFGYWIIHSLLGLNPAWNISLEKLFGSGKFCLWSFLIGGNVAGILIGIISYPIFNLIFTKLSHISQQQNATMLGDAHENHNHK